MTTQLDRSSLGFGFALFCGTLAGATNPACLSDEFDNGATLSNWTRIEQAEAWPNDPLQTWNINTAIMRTKVAVRAHALLSLIGPAGSAESPGELSRIARSVEGTPAPGNPSG